ncbi:hypothetical protein [Alkaliphilus sp. B6464]|uniref:hypothetical protein n=1 Tax=Alkaliphilus sp. B6464 TaxID=2731219 RepID=UPI001BA65CFA|nr:hypothetical protein [Alkaliphilus sp. B6464]QUH21980.1 hypothetical protein HYG84_18925 [Alkaliphilus sp. B6464]
MKKFKFKKLFKILLPIILILATILSAIIPAFAEKNNVKLSEPYMFENIPIFTDEEYSNAPVRITIFGTSWCLYCKKLEEDLPKRIYEKYTKEQVAIKVFDKDNSEILPVFDKMMDSVNMHEKLRGKIPSTFINEEYNYIGYHPEEVGDKIIADIDALLQGKEVRYGGNNEELLKTISVKESKSENKTTEQSNITLDNQDPQTQGAENKRDLSLKDRIYNSLVNNKLISCIILGILLLCILHIMNLQGS